LPRSQRSVSAALVVVVALAALLAAGQWLQPQLDGRTRAPATTSPAPTTPVPTSPAPSSPTMDTDRPAGPSHITRVVATGSPVDAIAVTRQAVWLAVGGLVLRVDPATGRALVVPGVEDGAPVVDLAAGAGAVWAVTSAAGLLRIDPGTARLTAPNPRVAHRSDHRRGGR
jgi:streptogramin lyase